MPTPVEFAKQYHSLKINVVIDDPVARMSRQVTHQVELRKYFMMRWADGSEERTDFKVVTKGSKDDLWFQANKDRIYTAAMGKGAPKDYELALEWAARSKKIAMLTQASLQTYSDDHLGIDCSGFATNYLVACGKRAYSADAMRNTSAASYYKPANAVNDPASIRQGDLLVWMTGNSVKTDPGHVAVVDSYAAQSMAGGNMRVVEATPAGGSTPRPLASLCAVEKIIPKTATVPMILVIRRFGSQHRVCVMRV